MKSTAAIIIVAGFMALGCNSPTSPEPEPDGPAVVISIDSVSVWPGATVTLPLRFVYTADGRQILDTLRGFDLSIVYDPSVLTFWGDLHKGDAISSWEYFTWRTGEYPLCGDGECTRIRIVAQRNMDYRGPTVFTQGFPDGEVTSLKFWVTSDRDAIGTTTDISFLSTSCSDNTLTPQSDNRTYYMANARFGPDSDDAVVDTMGCIRRYSLVPALEFRHGRVTIEEPPPIAGDINLNGIPYEIGDMMFFVQLFDGGTPDIDPELISLAIANADCNGDGESLTVADYDYLIHVMFGDTEASDPLPPPYGETLNLELVNDGADWLITGTSSSPVSGLLLKLISPSGSILSAEWLGRNHVSFAARHRGDTLRGLALSEFNVFTPILEGDWPPPIRIRNADGSRPVIVGAEASTPPGSAMAVNVTQ